MSESATVDALTLEVVRGFLFQTVLDMRITLIRTAYAPILYDTHDFSCCILDARGEIVGMADDFSGHVFPMSLGFAAALEAFDGALFPGDVVAMNEPYISGTHLNDVALYVPYFAGDRLLFVIGVRAHFADVGGATAGSFSGTDTELYQEGLHIPPVKIMEKRRLNAHLWRLLFVNMRLSDEREGDALAMLDTAVMAEQRLEILCDKYGRETIERCLEIQLNSAEQRMRAAIAHLPDGDYHYEHYLDNSGLANVPIPLHVKLTVDAESLNFDFSGTAAQVAGPMNCGESVTKGAVFVIVKSWFDHDTPVNGGSFRPVDFVIPAGSLLAARLPAAVGGCWEVYKQVQALVVGLFAQVLDTPLGAEGMSAANHVYIGGHDSVRQQSFIFYEYPMGGTPATDTTDGVTGAMPYDAGDIPCVYPAESVEQRQPILVEAMEATRDGEGAGRHRSGFGITRRLRVLTDEARLNVMTDRAVYPPFGVATGGSGSLNGVTVIRDGQEIQPSAIPGKVTGAALEAGDVVVIRASAGGGVGDPLVRDVSLVLQDVEDGYVTLERARATYGVVISDGEVQTDSTTEMRLALRAKRCPVEVLAHEVDDVDEHGCRVCLVSPSVSAQLGVGDGDTIEYVGKGAAHLRAWVRVDRFVSSLGIPIGPRGRDILKVAPGDSVLVRLVDTQRSKLPYTLSRGHDTVDDIHRRP